MDTNKLKKLAQEARTYLIGQVTSKLALVLAEGSAARREAAAAVRELERHIRETSQAQVIEKVAYTWFNRFTALRFMDANGYTNPRVVTPAEGATRPEILADAVAGHFDEAVPPDTRNRVTALLDGRLPSRDAQGEAYRLLLVAACNGWHAHMPFMFEKIADYTELLMPEDLLSSESVLSRLRSEMTDEDCQDVEVIGWLYQFYISEKKDQVFAALKKNVKITPENIPAATQLFTPHWIVRYLVENSLGRLWLLNRPTSKLAERLDYYIGPEERETDFLRVSRPEDIRICDPACGSGHMLTYAFDLLHAIYEEEGYDASEIPGLILTNNLTGIEIDDRAGALAAFALAMKAAGRLGRRRFLRFEAQPNICVMQDVRFTPAEMQDVVSVVGRDLFTSELRETLTQFEHAKNFGSLILPKLRDPAEVLRVVRLKDFGSDLLLRDVQKRVLNVLEMAEALAPKYDVVVANPPYAGNKGLNASLQDYTKEMYPDSKADLFAAFIERGLSLCRTSGYNCMVTMQSWMFLTSYEKLRIKLEDNAVLSAMLHMGNMVMGIAFGTAATIWRKATAADIRGAFCFVGQEDIAEHGAPRQFPPLNARNGTTDHPTGFFFAKLEDFRKIPGRPIAYWVSDRIRDLFLSPKLSDRGDARQGLATSDNGRFVRNWNEVSIRKIGFGCENEVEAKDTGRKWFPYNKGGERRKWYGNQDCVLNWETGGKEIRSFKRAVVRNPEYYFRPSISWGLITSGGNSFRDYPAGFIYDVGGMSYFPHQDRLPTLALLNSSLVSKLTKILNPTVNLQIGDIAALPYTVPREQVAALSSIAQQCVAAAKCDWDSYETSWEFAKLPLLAFEHRNETLRASYASLRACWRDVAVKMQLLEQETNRILTEAYGLQEELTPVVPLEEVTLTCNPHNRYGGKLTEGELEARLLADTMAEFLHYAVGCMFGRYSLDAPGLVLANQGEILADYLARVPEPSFMPDEDNVVPVLDGDWFADDVTEQFRRFLRVTFGETRFQENLSFIEAALGKDIRKWFTRDFFDYHVRRFKKRPIYWMFSSPKGSFNALIYMHRYRPDTVSVVLNEYLREFISKLQTERVRLEKLVDDPTATQSQKTKALKDVSGVIKQIDELTEWERDVVFPLAQAKIEIDLDDGVKRNYPKFGAALKPIKGLEAADD